MGAVGSIVAKGRGDAEETTIKSDPPVELTIESTIEFILSSAVVQSTAQCLEEHL